MPLTVNSISHASTKIKIVEKPIKPAAVIILFDNMTIILMR